MNPSFTLSLVRELRGSPLTVLVACILLEQSGQTPITAQLLKDVTGYKDHTITDSLRTLESPTRQLITRNIHGWHIAHGFQLPLEFSTELSTTPVDQRSDPAGNGCEIRNHNSLINRDIRGFINSSSSSHKSKSKSFLLEEEEEGRNRDIRDSLEFDENHKLLRANGVGEPKATNIARMHHVTPEYITAHFAAIEGTALSKGTAIHRIEHQWSTENLPPAPTKSQSSEDTERYLRGKYAEWIEH
ncbi:MAG: hypothetical protein D4R38_02650 [Dehalococcoidia bacterium]|nr:MAG: hypothetical protein D4R38_02650 [Dehalococcoidia bacterium]